MSSRRIHLKPSDQTKPDNKPSIHWKKPLSLAITLCINACLSSANAAWVALPQSNDALMQNLTIPADAVTNGMWSAAGAWPFIGVHATLLPTGKVLTWGTNPDGSQQNGRYFDIWDPNLGLISSNHQVSFNATWQDSFCTTATYLGDGRLMITGGNSNGGVGSNLYTPSGNTIATGASNVADQRWYATMLALPDGRPIILGGMQPYTEGMYGNPDLSVTQGLASMTPEVFENGAWRTLFGANSRDAFGPDFLRTSYPRAWVTPSGRIFGVSTEKMWWLDPAGNGAITTAGNFKTGPNAATLPNVGATNSAVMYAPGKVLVVGGNALHNGFGTPGSNLATAIDVNGAAPVLTEQAKMNFPRHFPNTIVLPNGKVLVTGGETFAYNDPARGVFATETWDPATGTWQVGANARSFRGYHSISALLTNGTVLSVGGGNPGPAQLNGEVYYPPYLFRSVNGATQLAPRPVISAISSLSYAHSATLQMDMANANAISKVVLIGLSSGTHSFNNGQRYIPLTFSQQSIRISAMLPGNTLAPPGYYQVVAIDANGVPSKGAIIAIGQGVTAPPVNQIPYNPPVLSQIQAPIINAGGTATFTTAAAPGVTYSWNFGDGSPVTAFSANPTVTRMYAQPGVYGVTLTAKAADGSVSTISIVQAVANPVRTAKAATASSAIAMENRVGTTNRLFVVNPDNNSVGIFDTATNARLTEMPVGLSPRSVAIAPDGRIWVTNKGSATISIIDANSLTVTQTLTLPKSSQPHGLAFAPDGSAAYVVLEATGQLLKLNPSTGAQLGALNVGPNVRHVSLSADTPRALVSRFITPTLPGEATAVVNTTNAGGEVLVVNTTTMTLSNTVKLQHSDKVDNEIQGSGIPNYLGAAVISPDGKSAWVPSKQDNIKRGSLRNGQNLNFQNTVRAISSRIDLNTLTEDFARRVDHDNSSVGSAATYHPSGAYFFVALETSRQVAVMDAVSGRELLKVDVGRAPQALTVSPDGKTLYVQNFMDRNVSVLDLNALVTLGQLRVPVIATLGSINTEKLPAQVLQGKQLFYDARDARLARDSYLSCATCHNDAGHDGRVWDFTGFGEGLRNTIALNGRSGMGQGFLHWSANFDEVQDFETQIRVFAGGMGLMPDAQYNIGTRNQILGDKKAGVSADLDALAAYVGSLNSFATSPFRNTDGSLSAAAIAGQTLFKQANCVSCHTGAGFTIGGDASFAKDIGTLKPSSGKRLNGTLAGIDTPTLNDVWSTAPYLHDGSAATLADAIVAHKGVTGTATDLSNMVAYMQSIDNLEPSPSGGLPAGNLGYWKLDSASGNTSADSSGNGKTLTLASGASITPTGRFGSALLTNGIAPSSASTAGPVVNTADSFSVSAWVKLDNLNGWQTIVNQDGVNVSGLFLQYSQWVNNNKFVLTMHDVDNTASNAFRAVSTTTPVVGQWYHLVGVRDKAAGTMKIYVNGKLEGTTAYAGGWASNGSLNIGRGKYGGPNDWVAGAIDEVGAFGRALTDAEVSSLFSNGSASVTPPPAANLLPTVALVTPTANNVITLGSTTLLSANAADSDGSVARVEFYDGATLLATDTTAPFTATANLALGSHAITARAVDNVGAATTSAVVNVSVQQAAASIWKQVGVATESIAAGADGTVIVTNSIDRSIWKYNSDNNWTQFPGTQAIALAVVNANLTYHVGLNNAMWRTDNGGATWYQVGNNAKAIAAASDGTVLGTTSANTIWAYNSASKSYVGLPGLAKAVAVIGANKYFCIGIDNNVYRYNGTAWIQVGLAAGSISAGSDGTVLVTNTTNNAIWKYVADNNWVQIPGNPKSLAVIANNRYFAIGLDTNVYRN